LITWTPLFSKVVDSSLWEEPDYVVKIFITMLALKDADQVVRYNAYGIAQRARKTEKEVLDALKILSSPDKKRIEPQPFDGRRVEKVEGGWLLLNGLVYQEMMRGINRKEYKAAKQREYRERENEPAGQASNGDDKFEAFWLCYPRKVGRKAAERKFLLALKETTVEVMLKALEAQKGSEQWQKDGGRFIPHPATWLHQGRWADVVFVPAVASRKPGQREIVENLKSRTL
jgi:hypothetical protein